MRVCLGARFILFIKKTNFVGTSCVKVQKRKWLLTRKLSEERVTDSCVFIWKMYCILHGQFFTCNNELNVFFFLCMLLQVKHSLIILQHGLHIINTINSRLLQLPLQDKQLQVILLDLYEARVLSLLLHGHYIFHFSTLKLLVPCEACILKRDLWLQCRF